MTIVFNTNETSTNMKRTKLQLFCDFYTGFLEAGWNHWEACVAARYYSHFWQTGK